MVQGEVLMIVFYETKLNSEYIVQIANTQVDKLMYMKQDWIVNNNLKNKLPMGNTCEGTPGSAASHWWWASDACRQGHYPRNGRAGHPVRFFLGSTNRQKTHKGNALYNSSPLNQANAPQPHASPCSGLRSFWPFPFPSRSSCPPGSRRALKRQPRTTLWLTEIHHYQTSPYLGLSWRYSICW